MRGVATVDAAVRPTRAIALVVATLCLGACGGSSTDGTPTPSASPSATATAAASPSASATTAGFVVCTTAAPSASAEPSDSGTAGACEVAQILYPPSGNVCGPAGSGQHYADVCPVTTDLGAALDRQPLSAGGGGADPVCRCQNSYTSATYMVMASAGQPAEYVVQVHLAFGPNSSLTFDVIVDSVESGSLASDILCGNGDPNTSIKGSSPGACS